MLIPDADRQYQEYFDSGPQPEGYVDRSVGWLSKWFLSSPQLLHIHFLYAEQMRARLSRRPVRPRSFGRMSFPRVKQMPW